LHRHAEEDAHEVPKHSFGTNFAPSAAEGSLNLTTPETAMTLESAEIHFQCYPFHARNGTAGSPPRRGAQPTAHIEFLRVEDDCKRTSTDFPKLPDGLRPYIALSVAKPD